MTEPIPDVRIKDMTGRLVTQSDPIQAKWLSLGGAQGFLGKPVTGELTAPDGVGHFQYFQGGSIYWTPSTDAHVVMGAILDLWAAQGWEKGSLAYPVTDTPAPVPIPLFSTQDGWNQWNDFQGGSICWTPGHSHENPPIIDPCSGAIIGGGSTFWVPPVGVVVDGPIGAKYASLGWEKSALGFPVTEKVTTPDGIGLCEKFAGGSIFYSPSTGAHVVRGNIYDKWMSLKGVKGPLGYPLTDVKTAPDGVGQYADFQGGTIYYGQWNTHVLSGAIRDKWEALGWAKSPWGYPVSDVKVAPDGVGQYAEFQTDTGAWSAVYYTPATGVHQVKGAIYARWDSLGREHGSLGYPLSDELPTSDGIGRYSDFQWGSVYWTPSTGAHVVKGAIRDEWAALGREKSPLGYPLTDELTTPDGIGRYNDFQSGSIYWTPSTSAHGIWGGIRDLWVSLGAEAGLLGYPMTHELHSADGVWRWYDFQNGTIKWSQATGTRFSFNRTQMLGLFGRIGAGGVVTANDFNTLKTWVGDPVGVEMPDYVRVLANKVVNGDPANATYQFLDTSGNVQTIPLGNLHAGSSSSQLSQLVNKWFLGIDEPTLFTDAWGPTSYQAVGTNIPLNIGGFTFDAVKQGGVGDCWLLASVATTAARAPKYLQDMFIYDGTNTINGATVGIWTVRFFHDNGVPDYVTVDTELPGGGHYYNDITHCKRTELWVALLEKAYAQENHSGWIGTHHKGSNCYGALDCGDASGALSALTGKSISGGFGAGAITAACDPHRPVVMGVHSDKNPMLPSDHDYAIVGFDPTNVWGMFEVFNPWGIGCSCKVYDLVWVSQDFLWQYFDSAAYCDAASSPRGQAEGVAAAATLLGTLPTPANATQGDFLSPNFAWGSSAGNAAGRMANPVSSLPRLTEEAIDPGRLPLAGKANLPSSDQLPQEVRSRMAQHERQELALLDDLFALVASGQLFATRVLGS
jgi:uncharacterized protein with LGFP repeats